MNEAQYMTITRQVITDESPLEVSVRIAESWILVSALQLVTRHPGLGDAMKQGVERAARQFQAAIAERHPEAGPLLEMGWNPAYDVVEKPPTSAPVPATSAPMTEDIAGRINCENLTQEEWEALDQISSYNGGWLTPTDAQWLAVRGLLALVDLRRGFQELPDGGLQLGVAQVRINAHGRKAMDLHRRGQVYRHGAPLTEVQIMDLYARLDNFD